MVFGLLTGYKFSSFRVFNWVLMRKNGKFQLKRYTIPGTGGQCLMIPPELVDGKMPCFLYNMGGCIFNALTVIACVALSGVLPPAVWIIGAVFGIILVAMNGIPRRKNISNDGSNALSLGKDPEAMRAFWQQMKMAEAMVKRLSPALIAHQGTDIGEALEVALLSFTDSTKESKSRVIILITDGEAHDSMALEVAERAKEEGVMICCIGIGTPEGKALEINGEMVVDEEGKMVVTKLNEQLLNDIASATGGVYIRSTNSSFGLDEVVAELDKMETTQLSHRNFEEYDEEYMWFLGVALLLLIVESLVLGRRNPLLKGVTLFDREKK